MPTRSAPRRRALDRRRTSCGIARIAEATLRGRPSRTRQPFRRRRPERGTARRLGTRKLLWSGLREGVRPVPEVALSGKRGVPNKSWALEDLSYHRPVAGRPSTTARSLRDRKPTRRAVFAPNTRTPSSTTAARASDAQRRSRLAELVDARRRWPTAQMLPLATTASRTVAPPASRGSRKNR